jgi:putative pre-16S rRNA nuclease
LGLTAQGLETLHRKNKRFDLEHLHLVVKEYEVVEMVVGLPLRLSGAKSAQSEKIVEFAEQLRQHFKLPVHLWDERLTTAEANRVLRDAELSIQRRAQVVDRLAAVLILQSFLDARATGFSA